MGLAPDTSSDSTSPQQKARSPFAAAIIETAPCPPPTDWPERPHEEVTCARLGSQSARALGPQRAAQALLAAALFGGQHRPRNLTDTVPSQNQKDLASADLEYWLPA